MNQFFLSNFMIKSETFFFPLCKEILPLNFSLTKLFTQKLMSQKKTNCCEKLFTVTFPIMMLPFSIFCSRKVIFQKMFTAIYDKRVNVKLCGIT